MIRYSRDGRIAPKELPGLIDAFIPHGFEYFLSWNDMDSLYTCVQQVEFADGASRDNRKLVLYAEASRKRGTLRCDVLSTTVEQFQKTLAVNEHHLTTVTPATKAEAPKRIVLYTVAPDEAVVQKILASSKAAQGYEARLEALFSGILEESLQSRTAVATNLVSDASIFYVSSLAPWIEQVSKA